MDFISSRGEAGASGFREVIRRGLAPDRGLYLPRELPDLSPYLESWSGLDYGRLCSAFFRHFATDFEPANLDSLVEEAYSGFEDPGSVPLRQIGSDLYVLELFTGPTLAFKDYALQLLGRFYAEQIRESGRPINVLGATSGDTGAAAISGLAGVEGAHTFILYPQGKVSPLQERQMTCTGSPGVFPLAIEGSFDDAQRELKALFGDREQKEKLSLSAVNSINLARILAQCVYYLYAWLHLPKTIREEMEVVVPTGNFGNVFAGWILGRMGVPLRRFRVATNQNDILFHLFQKGCYEVGAVKPSLAPSMDIQVASNFERLLYYFCGEDPEKVCSIMDEIRESGRYDFGDLGEFGFRASRTTDEEILALLDAVYRRYGYLCDPHTATAFKDLDPERPSLILATAHPAKFPETCEKACGVHPRHPSLEALKKREPRYYPILPDAAHIASFIAEHPASL